MSNIEAKVTTFSPFLQMSRGLFYRDAPNKYHSRKAESKLGFPFNTPGHVACLFMTKQLLIHDKAIACSRQSKEQNV